MKEDPHGPSPLVKDLRDVKEKTSGVFSVLKSFQDVPEQTKNWKLDGVCFPKFELLMRKIIRSGLSNATKDNTIQN